MSFNLITDTHVAVFRGYRKVVTSLNTHRWSEKWVLCEKKVVGYPNEEKSWVL